MNRRRILLIDDEVGFTEAVKINLELSGKFEVGVENDSMKAVETARKFEPDLIVLDIVMPEKDGGDLLAEFAGDSKLKKVPVVMLTALVSNEESTDGEVVHSGGETMLAKPVSTDKLIATIEAKLA